MVETTTAAMSALQQDRMVVTPPAAAKEKPMPSSVETAAETPTGTSPETLEVIKRKDDDISDDEDDSSEDSGSVHDLHLDTTTTTPTKEESRVAQLSQMANPIPSPESVTAPRRVVVDLVDVSVLVTPTAETTTDDSSSGTTPHKPTKLSYDSSLSARDHKPQRVDLRMEQQQEERPTMEAVLSTTSPASREAVNLLTGQTTILHRLPPDAAALQAPYPVAPVESFSSVPFDCISDARHNVFPPQLEDEDDDDEEELLAPPASSSPALVRTLFGWVEAKKSHSPIQAMILSDRDVGLRRELELVDGEPEEEQKRFLPAMDTPGYNALVASKWFGTYKDEDEPPHISKVQESIMEALENKREVESQKKKDRKPRNWTMICLYASIIAVLLIIIAFASMLLVGKMNEDSVFAPQVKGNEGGTQEENDDSLFPGGFFSTNNQFCTGAYAIERIDVAYKGNTENSNWDDNIDTCGDFMAIGKAAWFVYRPETTQLMEASTCGDATVFDTKITIATGKDCEALSCVTFNDQACGDQSRAVWYAIAGETYYINVHGFRDARGEFELNIQPTDHNDQCNTAEGPVSVGSTIFGTTAGSTLDMDRVQCGDVNLIQHPGVWYSVEDADGWIRADAVSRHTGFIPQLSIYSGTGCDLLACEGGSSSGSYAWRALKGQTYYILVNGLNSAYGDFDLSLSWEFQDSCEFATPIPVSGSGFEGTTVGARLHDVPTCGNGGFHTAPGMWLSVSGTGNLLAATTCGVNSDLDSHISIFRNGCNALQCVASTGQDLPCGTTGAVTWFSQAEEEYLIYVSGRGSRVGDFTLKVSDSTTKAGEICPSAVALGSYTTLVTGITTTDAPLVNEACGNIQNTRGMWYTLEGTGSTFRLSTCDIQTNFDARVSIFTGSCGSLQCEAISSLSCSDLLEEPFEIDTIAGVNYYMLVHGSSPLDVGTFRLTLTEQVRSNSCANALPIASSANTYMGSTQDVPGGRVVACVDGVDTLEGPAGVWYTIIGTGDDISLSTCSMETTFATNIHVFTGACFNPTCLDTEETPCGRQQVVAFPTTRGESYYIRVSGANDSEVGNFALDVSVRTSFMGF